MEQLAAFVRWRGGSTPCTAPLAAPRLIGVGAARALPLTCPKAFLACHRFNQTLFCGVALRPPQGNFVADPQLRRRSTLPLSGANRDISVSIRRTRKLVTSHRGRITTATKRRFRGC